MLHLGFRDLVRANLLRQKHHKTQTSPPLRVKNAIFKTFKRLQIQALICVDMLVAS